MQTVFRDPSKVAHIWAHQTQSTARYRDNFRCDGALLFSYSTRVGHVVRRPGRDKNHIGELVAFLTSENYSMTTNRHMGEAWAATRGMERYSIPDLDSLSPSLATLARTFDADGGRSTRKAIRAYHAAGDDNGGRWRDGWQFVEAARVVEKWLGDNIAAILASADGGEESEYQSRGRLIAGARLIGAMAGYTDKEVTSILDKAAKAEAKRKADAEKREHAARIAEGRRIADMSDSEFAELFPRDGSRTGTDDYAYKEGAEFAKRLARLHKASKAEGLTKRTAELWRKVKLYRAHLAGRDARIIKAYRAELAADVIAWRKGEGKRPDAWRYSRRFPAIARAITRSEARENSERHAAAFAAWQAGEGPRPSHDNYELDSAEHAAILASVETDNAAFLARFALWQRGEGMRPARINVVRIPGVTAAHYSDLNKANEAILADEERKAREAREAAERERQRERFARAAEFRRAWLAGEREHAYSADGGRLSDELGGALLRAMRVERDASGAIIAGELETSHGADVPLIHAIKAFRFVKLVRARGETWKRNGRTIRVGHYQIDAIDAGGFTAGCHRINWPEIERLARELGVFDAPADDSAVVTSAHA